MEEMQKLQKLYILSDFQTHVIIIQGLQLYKTIHIYSESTPGDVSRENIFNYYKIP